MAASYKTRGTHGRIVIERSAPASCPALMPLGCANAASGNVPPRTKCGYTVGDQRAALSSLWIHCLSSFDPLGMLPRVRALLRAIGAFFERNDMKPFKHILVPTDFEQPSLYATDLAVALATTFDAELTLLHVWEIPVYPHSEFVLSSVDLTSKIERAAAARLDEALRKVRLQLPKAKSRLQMGVPWQEIMSATSSLHADLIVMGTHGRHGLRHAFLGSVAEKVVRLSTVPVLTAHAPTEV
jgi:nucleotide-binding universal stress UspA family protein